MLPLENRVRGLPVRINPGHTVVTTTPSFLTPHASLPTTDQRKLAGAIRHKMRNADLPPMDEI